MLPLTLQEIGDNAFQYCKALTLINYSGTEEDWNELIIGSNNQLLNTVQIVFAYIGNPDADMILPFNLTEIGEEAFSGGRFTCAKVMNGVTYIGSKAFRNCRYLRAIYILNPDAEIEEDAFIGVPAGLKIYSIRGGSVEQWAHDHSYVFVDYVELQNEQDIPAA